LFAADCCNYEKSGGTDAITKLPPKYKRKWPELRKIALLVEGQSVSESPSERHFKGVAIQHMHPATNTKERASFGVKKVGMLAYVRE
jgi:hypothetical protein